MYSTLLTDLTDHVLTITINRPDKLNAINAAVMSELDQAVNEIYTNPAIKSAILTGAGPKAFVAGADISEFLGLNREQGQAMSAKGHGIFFRIENSPKPIVAAVNGFALGGGCELAMACHFRLCSPNAKFGQPEVNLGLIPGYGGTQRLPQLIGKARALELMLTGALIDAQEALRLGLVNYVVPQEELLSRTKEIMAVIGDRAPIAIARIIESVNNAYGHMDNGNPAIASAGNAFAAGAETRRNFLLEQQAFGDCFATEDMREGAQAFLEKRKAYFTGK
jgi:enoyl-CoA hydratase